MTTSPGDRVPSTFHIDGSGNVQDQQGNRLDLTKPEFSEINRAMSSQGQKAWDEGDYRLENGRLVQAT